MNTQSPSVHIRQWHRSFWLLSLANLLLSMSVTMLIPTMPLWMTTAAGATATGMTAMQTGVAMGSFAVGLFLPGPFCSYLVQRYRRGHVCVLSILVLALSIVAPTHLQHLQPWAVTLWRMVQGAAFGLAQMVLSSTLIIDTCESCQRTEANHSATWFGRFALSLGPMTGLMVYGMLDARWVSVVSAGCCCAAAVLIMLIRFPFRVPQDSMHLISTDRFFLPEGLPLFVNLMTITVGVGLLLSLPLSEQAYAMMMIGFVLALLAQRFVFRDAELKSEVVSGLLLIIASQLILTTSAQSPLTLPLLGLGLGIVGARFLLFFIKLSRHCQRGTSQSTFMLAWESGLAIGIGVGHALFEGRQHQVCILSLVLTTAALAVYVCFMHRWFVAHKNR